MYFFRKVKENKAVALTDVIVGMLILMLFTGILTTWLYEIYKHNYKTKVDALVTNYMVKIAEKIDYLPYEQVNENLSLTINQLCDIPEDYNVSFLIEDYDLNGTKQDIIKYVTINLEYELLGENMTYSIKKLKIKEM